MPQHDPEATSPTKQDRKHWSALPPRTWLGCLIVAGVLSWLGEISRLSDGAGLGAFATAVPEWVMNVGSTAFVLASAICVPEGRSVATGLALGATKATIVGGCIGHFLLRPAALALGL